jgi:acetyl esterase
MSSSVNEGVEEFPPSVLDRIMALGGRSTRYIPEPFLNFIGRRRNSAGARLDGDVAISLSTMQLVSRPDISTLTPQDARRAVEREAFLAGSGGPAAPDVESVSHRTIRGVRVRVYMPPGQPEVESGPAMIYIHGGGFVTGSLDSHDSTCRYFCARAGIPVFSIDYRLAPEHPFPAAHDDCGAVVLAILEGEIPEVDPRRVMIAGDSAGANLTCTLCLWLRDNGHPQPAYQMMFVPAVDQREMDVVVAAHGSRAEFVDGPYMTRSHMEWYDALYLGGADNLDRTSPLVSPLLAEDLSGLAPAYVAVAGFDPLRDEGEEYARKLADAGVQVTLRRHDGLVHPFVNGAAVWSGSRRALDEAVGAVRAALQLGV